MLRMRAQLWSLIIIVSAVAVGLVLIVDVWPPLRQLVGGWFLLVCPGMAFVRLLRLSEAITQWTLAIALSLALDAIVAVSMLYAGLWSPQWGLAALIGVSLIGAVIQYEPS